MRTDRLVDEDGHGEVDRQYDPNSVDEQDFRARFRQNKAVLTPKAVCEKYKKQLGIGSERDSLENKMFLTVHKAQDPRQVITRAPEVRLTH